MIERGEEKRRSDIGHGMNREEQTVGKYELILIEEKVKKKQHGGLE